MTHSLATVQLRSLSRSPSPEIHMVPKMVFMLKSELMIHYPTTAHIPIITNQFHTDHTKDPLTEAAPSNHIPGTDLIGSSPPPRAPQHSQDATPGRHLRGAQGVEADLVGRRC